MRRERMTLLAELIVRVEKCSVRFDELKEFL